MVTSLHEYLRGNPKIHTSASKSPKVLITWLHMDEPLAPIVAHHIYTKRPDLAPHIDYICGNPKDAANPTATLKGRPDLNRSFITDRPPITYEEKLASKISQLADQYQYVLDLHGAVDPRFGKAIFVSRHAVDQPAVRQIIAASPIKRIIVIPAQSHHSLIGVKQNAVSVEYSIALAQKQGLPDCIDTLDNLLGKKTRPALQREFYYVEGSVPKSQDPGPKARNFEFWEPGGYYPILLGSGPRSYRQDPTKDYCCFYAKRMESVVL